MKKYINILLATGIIASALLTSCKKLDSPVYDQVIPQNFLKTPQQVNSVLAPAYSSMTGITFGSTFILNEASSDEFIVPTRGNDWFDGGKWQALWLHKFTFNTINNVNGSWNTLSSGIVSCNRILNIINTLPANAVPSNAPQIIAEIKTLRAYYYMLFMDEYGRVPLVTDYNTSSGSVAQSSRKDVYDFIEKELTTNVPLLADKADANYGHLNKWGGYMALARLYLNAQVYTGTPQWAKAAAAADAVIKSGKYSLQPNYLDNFIVMNESSGENIFVVPYDNIYIGGNIIVQYSLNYNNNLTYGLTSRPFNGYSSPTAFYKSFSTNDVRIKGWEIGQQFDAGGTPLTDPSTGLKVVISPYINELSNPADTFKYAGARLIKYAPQSGDTFNASNDGVIYRLADAYLIKAEAQIRLGTVGDALTLVNAIRTRAGVPLWTLADLTLKNLLAERGRELYWELTRRDDLIRFEVADNIPYFTGARVPAKTQDADQHTFIYPIPQQQMISNSKLTQNPGY